MNTNTPLLLAAALGLTLATATRAAPAAAEVTVDKPWVRTTVPQQTATGAFMTITAAHGGKLVSASSPVAASVEVHETKMDGTMMKMRPVAALPLPAGKPVDLKAGEYHMMLTGLKAPVKFGDVVPITLVVEDAHGQRATVEVKATAKLVMQD